MGMLPSSSIDRRLLAQAAKYATPNEMSEAVMGELTPAECVVRVKELLASKTIYDEIEERRLLLIQQAEWLDWLKTQRDNDKSWSAINRAMKQMSDQIERSNININDVSAKLSTEHARYFVEGFMLGFNRVLEEISKNEITELSEEYVEEVSLKAIETSREYLEKVTERSDS